jgi:hypothetical protein
MFLTAEQLAELTGYRKPALQRRWLANNGYSFDVRGDGKPVVSRAHYEARHTAREHPRPSAFNLAALDNLK